MATLYDYLLPVDVPAVVWDVGGGASTREEAVFPITVPPTSTDDSEYIYDEDQDSKQYLEPADTVALPSGATITAVEVVVRARHSESVTAASLGITLANASDESSPQNTGVLTDSFANYTVEFTTAPDDSSSWTKTLLDGLTGIGIESEWGVGKLTGQWEVSAAYIRVSFTLTASDPGDSNLVLQCKCDDHADNPTVTDSSESEITGTCDCGSEDDYTNNITNAVNQFVGDRCFDLDGTDDYFYFADSGYLNFYNSGVSDMSCVIAVNFDTLAAGRAIIHKDTTSGSVDRTFHLVTADLVGNYAKILLRLGDPSDGSEECEVETDLHWLEEGEWCLIGFTFDSGDLHMYVNGNEVSYTVTEGAIPSNLYENAQDLEIGRQPLGTTFSDAKFDQIQLFNDILTNAEMLYLWNDGNGYEFSDITGNPWNFYAQQS